MTMIIDCHAHVFMHWITATGHPTRETHKRYMQRMVTRTVASTFRARDGAKADTKALYRTDDTGWTGLKDVDFRVGKYGQLEFTDKGEDYVIQYMPVGMQEMVAPPELMLAQMMTIARYSSRTLTQCIGKAARIGLRKRAHTGMRMAICWVPMMALGVPC
jgi:hypothetical protein